MAKPIQELAMAGFGTEIIYSFVIILCSLMIYFGTKELYELSSYKGIKYFRQAFLFFAVAYFFRGFIKFVISYLNIGMILDISPMSFGIIFGPITLFIFMYFSYMAVFYLLYSVMLKKWDGNFIYLFHGLAFIIPIISILSRNYLVYVAINLTLFAFFVISVCTSYKGKKNKKNYNLYAIYLLLLSFWIINIIDILIPEFFQTFQLLIYMASTGIFLTILYKVIKKTGN